MRRTRDTAQPPGGVFMSVAATTVAKGITAQYALGSISIGMGALIAFTGPDVGDRARWFAQLLGWPVGVGVLFVTSGLLVIFGLLRRSARVSLTGYLLSVALYVAFAVGFLIQWNAFLSNPVGDPPFVYPFATYLGYGVLHAIFGEALIRERRAVRAAERELGPGR